MIEIAIIQRVNGPDATSYVYQFDCPLCTSMAGPNYDQAFIERLALTHLMDDHGVWSNMIELKLTSPKYCDEVFIMPGKTLRCSLETHVSGDHEAWFQSVAFGVRTRLRWSRFPT